MVGWHPRLDGHGPSGIFEQGPRVGDGQGSLAGYSPWGNKESDMTEQLTLKFQNMFIIPSQESESHTCFCIQHRHNYSVNKAEEGKMKTVFLLFKDFLN